jgi:hypothetical protein
MLVSGHLNGKLAGYLAAASNEPGFIVPLFQAETTNMFLVQKAGPTERLQGFREVDPPLVHPVSGKRQPIVVGGDMLWGFRDPDGETFFGNRIEMRGHLADMADRIQQPFLKLQVANFCENPTELVTAWRHAFNELAKHAPRSASAWRDVVVIPGQMRLAVAETVYRLGLEVSIDRLDQSVETEVVSGRLHLRLAPSLLDAFAHNAEARRSLEAAAALIRRAFDFPKVRVALDEIQRPPEEEVADDPRHDGYAIIGIGDLALSVLDHLERGARKIAAGGSVDMPEAPDDIPMLLKQSHLGGESAGAFDFDGIASIDARCSFVFVLFQLSSDRDYLLDAALRAAQNQRAQGRFLIAVIPHFPDEQRATDDIQEMLAGIGEYFDAIWILSDRSPYSRQSIPFGPSSSSTAAARNLRYLLARARASDADALLYTNRADSMAVGVVGSVMGNGSLPALIRTAMMRIHHYLFDFDVASAVHIEASSGRQLARPGVREAVAQEFPKAGLDIRSPMPGIESGWMTIAVSALGIRRRDGDGFEGYCMDQLERHGWSSWYAEQAADLMVTTGGLPDITLERKYFSPSSVEAALRARPRRKSQQDELLLSNATVWRRGFAVQVLGGVVPVHYTRIGVMERIYRRRYAYALAYLNTAGGSVSRIVFPPAIDWINLDPHLDSETLGRAELSLDRAIDFDMSAASIRMDMPLNFASHERMFVRPGRAVIRLDEDGWHLENVEVAERETPIG